MRVSGLTTEITGSPGQISRIEPGIRGITVSGGDTVTLSVDIYVSAERERQRKSRRNLRVVG